MRDSRDRVLDIPQSQPERVTSAAYIKAAVPNQERFPPSRRRQRLQLEGKFHFLYPRQSVKLASGVALYKS